MASDLSMYVKQKCDWKIRNFIFDSIYIFPHKILLLFFFFVSCGDQTKEKVGWVGWFGFGP
jgi:hypothetical protein